MKGQEIKTLGTIREHVTTGDEEAFIMEDERMYKHQGKWEKDRENMFPGYLFVITGDPAEFNRRLRSEFNKRLRGKYHTMRLLTVDGVITAIHPEEEDFLKNLGGEDHIVRYSEGFRDGDRIVVESGSLKGFEGRIKKVDRHNRQAIISMSLFGRDIDVTIGLGILRSNTSDMLRL